MNAQAYLERINYHGSLAPNADTLRALQVAHMLSVPFENLSIHAKQPIVLDDDALYKKIVERRRGGFCYELNGLFAALLRTLGFDVAMLAASVAKEDGGFGFDFAHMTLLVTLDDRWLVDVGFGDSFREPLLLNKRDEQPQGERSYRIDADGMHRILMQCDNGQWEAQYRFTLQPHVYADYEEMCHYQQTSPQSHFTQRRICSRATPDGRLTLSDMRFITTEKGQRREREIANEEEYSIVLREQFGIEM